MQWGEVDWGEPLNTGDAMPMEDGDMLEVEESQPLPPPTPSEFLLWESNRSMNTLAVEEYFPVAPPD